MEYKHREQRAEFVPDHTQIQPDNDGMDDDTEFEDEESGNLLFKGEFSRFRVFFLEYIFRFEFRVIHDLCCCLVTCIVTIPLLGDGVLDVGSRLVAIFDLHIPLRPKVQQEDSNDRGQHDPRTPRVVGPMARHAHA